ncbi:MAG: phosphatase PAP2 family protein [Tahibacter sp.]
MDAIGTHRTPWSSLHHARDIGGAHLWRTLITTGCLLSALLVLIFAGSIAALDLRIAGELHAHSRPLMTGLMRVISISHGLTGISILSAALALYFASHGQRKWLVLLIIATPTGMLLNAALKLAFERVRPHFDDPLVLLYTYSFPSGHVAASTVFYAIIGGYLATRMRSRPWRAIVAAWSLLMIMLVATSRLYLGAHYLSDVLGGFVESIAWLALCVAVVDLSLRDSARWTQTQ